MTLKLQDLTQVLQETTRRGVGTHRWQHPVYKHFLPPCNHACPAGEDIQGWLALAQSGAHEQAWHALVNNNPMPATHGRACYHPCETACNRGELDSAVSIHAVERFLGDLAVEKGWSVSTAAPTGKRVLVVGAGPAGLSCAYHLARLGHGVEIHDAGERPGGMMQYGIPAYRLPREPLEREIARITTMPGVSLHCGRRIEDVVHAKAEGGFDAVFVGVGAQLANHLHIPSGDGYKMVDAISLLSDVSQGKRPLLGRRVAIVGGGNVAMDAARTAERLGATETVLIFRYDEAHMEAHKSEADEAFAEGTKIRWLSVIDQFGADGITVEKVSMNPDGSVTPTGEVEHLSADAVVLAVGQHSDLSLLHRLPDIQVKHDGTVTVDATMMTAHAGIFAGGDCIGGARTMTAATGHGKQAARAIDAYLQGKTYQHPESHPLVGFGMLHLPDFMDAAPHAQTERPPQERQGFEEITAGLTEQAARREAQRCLSCGNCFECDNCFAACPEQAITRLGPGQGYEVSMDLCTGCAACFEQCPCHAIEMEPEPTMGGTAASLAPAGFKLRA
ncbi:NAD(P)-binding protein [Acidocella sp.]|uniref:NAD(P)-binding protein n=1 Tax=Acidocella sp. TaxID=50710 RepID=UPI003D07F6D5